jgi:pyrrolidone-carboxylate peptidase
LNLTSTKRLTPNHPQPFQDRFPINPSFEIAKLLPAHLPSLPNHHPTPINLIIHPTPIRVSYAQVRALIPALLSSYVETIDLVLHIGMASSRDHYALERQAHRDGYGRNADVDGEKPKWDEGEREFGDCKHILTTTVDYDGVYEGWRANLTDYSDGCDREGKGRQLVPTAESNDPGHYLCDYIYFNSLAWFERRGRKDGGGGVEGEGERPVLFLHVPAESDAVTLRKGVVATTALLRSMAESWSASRQSRQGKIASG